MYKCPLCAGKQTKKYSEVATLEVLACENCGLKFIESAFSKNLNQYYQDDYAEKRGHDAEQSVICCKTKTSQKYLSLLEKMIPAKGKLLEIGCSTGIFLEIAQAHDWEVTGIEISRQACKMANERLKGNKVFSGSLEDISLSEKYFSAVVLFDVLEHLTNPIFSLSYIHKVLGKGGILLIVTPNIDSLSGRLLKEKWPHLLAEHVLYYSKKSICYLASKTNFEVLQLNFAYKYVNLNMLKRHWTLHPHVFGAKTITRVIDKLPENFGDYPFYFNFGETCAILRKK